MKRSTPYIPRWLWLNHVPTGLTLTAEQRAKLRRRVRGKRGGKLRWPGVGRTILLRLVPATVALCTLFTIWLLWLVKVRLPPARFAITNILGILLFQAMTWVIIAWSINRAMAPIVWRALNQMGFRVCEGCGYIIDYLPLDTSKCPECGKALHPPTNAPS